ncbi:hypothetical protein PMAYCL1PPCAC_16686, partial [Pristionchus mayeri]
NKHVHISHTSAIIVLNEANIRLPPPYTCQNLCATRSVVPSPVPRSTKKNMTSVMGRRVCLICGAPTNYAHFGIDSCRACAEFYKRAVSTNKKYACRQGNLKCTIRKNERFVCRRCRFDKCRDSGMVLDDPRRRKRREEAEEPMVETISPGPSPPGDLPTSKESIIDRITIVHNEFVAARKAEELRIRPGSLREHVRVPHQTEYLELTSWKFLMDCCKMYAGEVFALAGSCFPEFGKLWITEKFTMLRCCAVRIYLLEIAYQTIKNFGPSEGPMVMVSLTTCLDRKNIKFLIKDSNPSARHGDIINAMTHYIDRLAKILWPTIGKLAPTEVEFQALFGLVFWQIDPTHSLPDRLVELSEKNRQEIFADLRRYYREELRLNDHSVRLGNLMTIEHVLQEATSLFSEDMQTYNLLDMLTADAPFLRLVLQITL